eukprot:7234960-Prymnesium_polylepis.1
MRWARRAAAVVCAAAAVACAAAAVAGAAAARAAARLLRMRRMEMPAKRSTIAKGPCSSIGSRCAAWCRAERAALRRAWAFGRGALLRSKQLPSAAAASQAAAADAATAPPLTQMAALAIAAAAAAATVWPRWECLTRDLRLDRLVAAAAAAAAAAVAARC